MSRRIRRNKTSFSLFIFQDIITCVMGIMLLLTLLLSVSIATTTVAATPAESVETVRRMRTEADALSADVERLRQTLAEQQRVLNSGAIHDTDLLRKRTAAMNTDNRLTDTDVQTLLQQQVEMTELLPLLIQREQASRQLDDQARALRAKNKALSGRIRKIMDGQQVLYNGHSGAAETCWIIEMLDDTQSLAMQMEATEGHPLHFASTQALLDWIKSQHRKGAAFMMVLKPASASAFEAIRKELRGGNVRFGFDLLPDEKSVIDSSEREPLP